MNMNVIFREKYGENKQTSFVNLPDSANVLVATTEKTRPICKGWWWILFHMFLPRGYPDSVSEDYFAYQKWDTAQAFCSTIMGILATQEVFKGVGVGEATSTPLAATVTWVFKDGCGHVARIIFAYCKGSNLDAYSKKWRLYADILNDAAMCIEIFLPFFTTNITMLLCLSSMMKSIVGVAGGATRFAMTRHHAQRANIADVAAKDAAQETAVNLIASLTALIIIYCCRFVYLIFFVMMVLHIVCNYKAVSSICLRTFNETRFRLVIKSYLELQSIAGPKIINKLEPIFSCPRWLNSQIRNALDDNKIYSYEIKIGQSLKNLTTTYTSAFALKALKEMHADKNYMVVPDTSNLIMHVFLKEGASPEDVLCGYFHAVVLSAVMETVNVSNGNEPRVIECRLPLVREASYTVCEEYREQNFRAGNAPFKPSLELLKAFVLTVSREWEIYLKPLLQTKGWDLKKHLLMLDEWRITQNPPLNTGDVTEPMLQ